MTDKPLVGITMGDPAGIGAEVIAKALTEVGVHERCRPFVIGSVAAMAAAVGVIGGGTAVRRIAEAADAAGDAGAIDVLELDSPSTGSFDRLRTGSGQVLDYEGIETGQVSAEAGRASVEWVLKAGELAKKGEIAAIATAPINKEAARLAGYEDVGHMEIFQSQTGASNVATMLMAGRLRVVHLTTHRSLRRACDYVTTANVFAKTMLTHEYFKTWGFPAPRIAVAALNPHASDGGLIGDEEAREITPAVQAARAQGADVTGPVPADTVFNQAIDGRYDVVLAMYHDQGHVAIKVHDWARSVSVNLGLPFIRTSVDHGTAFDIAGKGVADHRSMLEAIGVAVDLAAEGRLR